MQAKGVLNAFQLKMLMATLMLLDHLHYYLPGMPDWFTWLGRLVAPTFLYLMVESFIRTSDQVRYIRRLAVAGLGILAGNTILSAVFQRALKQDIILSMAISAAILYYYEGWRKGNEANALYAGILFMVSYVAEGSIMCPILSGVFYWLRGRRGMQMMVYVITAVLLSVILFENSFPQVLMVFAVLPMLLYSGERGPGGGFPRRFFYLFYPAHIWILFIVQQLCFAPAAV